MRSLFFPLLLSVASSGLVAGFGVFSKTKSAPTKTSALTDEAVAIYQKNYPDKGPRKRSFFAGAGMPVRDFDGTEFKQAKGTMQGKAFSDREPKELQATFSGLASYFGEQESLQMVKDFPLLLACNRNNIVPNMQAFSETFGQDDATSMVRRNPSLLFMRPSVAADADDLTMQFSYIVAYTRPAGPFLLYGLLALLLEPAFETFSGIPLKAIIFGS